jgi:transposase InsO family protein
VGVSISFASPLGALVALVGLVPLAVLLAGRQRLRALCATLGLRPPSERSRLPTFVALLALVGLLALAAAQPVAARQTTSKGRADAEAFFVFDVSRSMGARAPGGPSRLERAKADGKRLRAALPDLPVGVASLTDRLLPHLFPSVSLNAFNATVDDGLGIDRPTSSFPYGNINATKVGSLGDLVTGRYFPDSAKRRIVVLFTDGESRQEDFSTLPTLFGDAHVKAFFFRYWSPQERIYVNGRLNTAYAPDPTTEALLPDLARALSTRVFSPGQTTAAAAAIRAAIGKGPITTRGRDLGSVLLTPYVLLLALVPLVFLIVRTEGLESAGRAIGRWRSRSAA